MRISHVDAIPVTMRFSRTFKFGSLDRTESTNVIVELRTDEGLVGYGEACPVPAFTGESWQSIVANVTQRLSHLLIGADPRQPGAVVRALENTLVGSPFTLTAIDTALWDLRGKALNVPVSTLLGGRFRETVPQHGSVGIDTKENMCSTALGQVEQGFTTLKLYGGRDSLTVDLDRLRAVREAVGSDVDFMLDINGRWDRLTCLRALADLADLGVSVLEQPLPAWDHAGLAEVAGATSIDIMADEAVFGVHDVVRLAHQQSARSVNLGLSKLGGPLRASECGVVARAAGLRTAVGSVLELGIASTAGLHLAASLPRLAGPAYLLGPLKYDRQITSPPFEIHNGAMEVPDGPGLGIDVDVEFLHQHDARR